MGRPIKAANEPGMEKWFWGSDSFVSMVLMREGGKWPMRVGMHVWKAMWR